MQVIRSQNWRTGPPKHMQWLDLVGLWWWSQLDLNKKLNSKVCATARACVARFTRATPRSASTASHHLHTQKNVCQNSIIVQSYGPCRIFFHIQFVVFPPQIWPYPRQKPQYYVAAPGACLAGKPMGAQAQHVGTMCGAHETFQDWSTHQGQALCETTSVTWRFLQLFLKRFWRTLESLFNFFVSHLAVSLLESA